MADRSRGAAGRITGRIWAPDARVDLALPWPPSGNRYWRIFVPPNKPQAARMIRSAEATRYVRRVIREISTRQLDQLTHRLAVRLEFHAPTRRAYDLDNRAKVLLDALQHSGLIQDDGLIDVLHLVRGRVQSPGQVLIQIGGCD